MFIKCFAKVNLFLNITEKRDDGFHNLESLFQNITLFDIIKLNKADSFGLIVSSNGAFTNVCSAEDNILSKIFYYFQDTYEIPSVKITLEKNIPLGAGLGGGSSDGAGLIFALNDLFNLNLSTNTLMKIGDLFGSDVPFFIKGGNAVVKGKGEVILPYPFSNKFYYVLVYPDFHISTSEAYSENVILNNDLSIDRFTKALHNCDIKNMHATTTNSFEQKTLEKYETLNTLYWRFKRNSEFTLLSGSGSSMFALFNDYNNAKKCYNSLMDDYKYCYLLENSECGIYINP